MRLSPSIALAAALAASAPFLACAGAVGRVLAVPAPLGLEVYLPRPENNAPTRERIELGRRLFFDRGLSADYTISCSSCHRPERLFADSVAVSPGVYRRLGHRNTPSLLNVAHARHLTWDGRSTTLEEQVLKPIRDPVEMDLSLEELVVRINADASYQDAFRSAYDQGPSANGVALALSSFIRTLRSGNAPVDQFRAGQTGALAPVARGGAQLFVGKARCSICHAGPMFNDGKFHNTGVTARSGSDDVGRYARTGASADERAFRTPSLRNVARTAPYMHDGTFGTLEEVIEFYDSGGGPDAQRDADLRPLGLTATEKQALAAFLRSLDGS